MTILIATGFLTFGLIITLVTSLPTRIPRDLTSTSSSCSLTQIRGNTRTTSQIQSNSQCIKLQDSKVPTTLEIQCSTGNSANALKAFSSINCNDESMVVDTSLTTFYSSQQSQPSISSHQLNQRRPICSFRLGRNPFPKSSVTVQFSYENNERYPVVVDTKGCKNICGENLSESLTKVYPLSVGLLENNGEVANNFVEIFSGRNCEGTRVTESNGSEQIFDGSDLVRLTRINRASISNSFRIVTNN